MSTLTPIPTKPKVNYPESDGLPLSDNTRQFRWIMTIQGGLDAVYADDPNVFVAGNLLWYPIENDNKTRSAPDIFARQRLWKKLSNNQTQPKKSAISTF